MTKEKKKPKRKLATRPQIGRIVNMLLSGEIDRAEATEIIERDRKQDPNLAFWEERFPGKGEALMEILRPFYDWKPELKPAIPGLEEQAKKAVFWRDVSKVRLFQVNDADSLRASLRDKLWDSLRVSLGLSLRDSLWESLWYMLGDSLRTSCLDSLRVSLGLSLRDSLMHTCGFFLADKPEEAAKFKPLLDLWLAGNYPVGFDKEGNLLVLVADPE